MVDLTNKTDKELAQMIRENICPKIGVFEFSSYIIDEILRRFDQGGEEINLGRLEDIIKFEMFKLRVLQSVYRKATGRDYKPFL